MPDAPRVIGLDYGQTRVKAVLVDPESGDVERLIAVPPPAREATCRIGEVTYRHLTDPDALLRVGVALLRELVPPDSRTPVAVAVSSADPPLVAVARDLAPVWPVVGHWDGVSWEELDDAFLYEAGRFYQEAGSPRCYQPPVFHLAWLVRRDPRRAERVA